MIYKLKKIYIRLKESFIAQPKNQKRIIVFVAVIFVGIILAFIISGIDSIINGGYFFVGSSLFFQDVGDAFMDFFNVNYFVQDMDPYIGSGSSYPPMVLLFAKIFQLIQGAVGEAKIAQTSLRGIIALLIYFGIFFICAWLLLRAYMKRKCVSLSCSVLLYFGLLCSSPMLFAIDRGNYLLYTFLFLGYFLLYYKSEKRWQRELSYLSLALAVSFKIYPAIFALLLLNKKDWLNFIKTATYSIMLLILPLLAFKGGFSENFRYFLENLLSFQSQSGGYYSGDVWYLNGYTNTVSIVGITAILCSAVSGIPIAELPSFIGTVANIVAVLLAVVVVVAFFMNEKDWVKLFLLTSIMTFVLNTNYEYNLIFFIFPLLAYLTDDGIAMCKKNERGKACFIVCGFCLTFMFIPLPLGYLIPKYSHSLEHGYPVLNLIQVIAYLAMTIFVIVLTLKRFTERKLPQKNHN